MNNIVELSRRIHFLEESGLGCGPCCTTAVDAEIVLNDNGETVYLFGQWVDAAGDMLAVCATKESVFDLYAKDSINDIAEDVVLQVHDLRDAAAEVLGTPEEIMERYAKQIREIGEMVQAELHKHYEEEFDDDDFLDCMEYNYF